MRLSVTAPGVRAPLAPSLRGSDGAWGCVQPAGSAHVANVHAAAAHSGLVGVPREDEELGCAYVHGLLGESADACGAQPESAGVSSPSMVARLSVSSV